MSRGKRVVRDADRETLSPTEFKAAFLALPKEEKIRIKLSAKWWTYWTPFDWKDLLHEAIMRAYAGDRKCPKDTSVARFLDGTMRSIRSEWMRDWRREQGPAPGDDFANSEELSPEDQLHRKNLIHRARSYLSGDDDALKFLTALLNDWTRSNCMEQFKWDKKRFETTRRRFNEKMAQLGRELRSQERVSTEAAVQ
jgi:DNA-directed RNA polymerase specialized sigma24 family protein